MGTSTEGHADRWQPSRGLVALIVVGVLFAVLLVVWRAWDSGAQRQLQAQIDAAHARGEKILLEDFTDAPPVPDDQNAAFYWKRAGAAADVSDTLNDRERDLSFLGQMPASPQELAWLREAIANRDAVWDDVRAAQRCTAVNWGVSQTALMTFQTVQEYKLVRRVVNLISYRALIAHVDGDDGRAVEDARTILRLACDADQLPPCIVTSLVATASNASAVSIVEQISPDLKIGTGPGEAPPDVVRSLIAELLDQGAADRGWSLAMQGERAGAAYNVGMVTGKPVLGTVQKIGLARLLKWEPLIDQAGLQADYPAARAILVAHPAPPRVMYGYIPTMAGILQPSMERLVEVRFRSLCERRFAAIALAIALYRADHNGALPKSLNELTPTYLPSLPPDPFAAGGRAFGYSPAATQPFIYSVGVDGTDDGGSRLPVAITRTSRGPVRKPDDPDRPFMRWDRDDALFYLVHPPRLAPTTQPAE